MITVFYKRPHNYHKSTYQNAARGIASKAFKTEEQARAFANTVELDSIYNNVGKKIG